MTEYNPGPQFRKSSGYGYRPDPFKPGETEFHTGVDFKAPIGTPIPAASDGEVVYSRFNKAGFGNTVIIRTTGADGKTLYYTQYSHMVGPGAAFGTKVRAGEVIGQVGSTGRSRAPHFHFEVLRSDAPVNKDNDPKENGIGFTTKLERDRQYRHDPTQFNNWAGGAPYDGSSGVAAGAETGQLPLPRPRPTIPGPSPVPSGESSGTPAYDSNWLASVLNPKPLTPDVARLGAWPQPPYPAGGFFPRDNFNDRFYFGVNPSSANPGSRAQAPLSPPTMTAPAPLPPQSASPTSPPSPASSAPHWLDPYVPRLDWLPPVPRTDSSDTSRPAAGSSAGDWLGLQRSDFGAFKNSPQGNFGKRSDLAPGGGDRFGPSAPNLLISMGLLRCPLDANPAPVPMQVASAALSPEPAAPTPAPSPEPDAPHWLDALASPPLSPSQSDVPPWLDPESVGKAAPSGFSGMMTR